MKRFDYRRKAVLARIHTTLDNFYLQQDVDWDYDVHKMLDRILELAMEELEFGEGKKVDRGLIIISAGEHSLEVRAGWRVEDTENLEFSKTLVSETLDEGKSVLCENALEDPRFENAESIRALEILSVISVPIRSEQTTLGAISVERKDAGHVFTPEDLSFVEEFATTIAPYIKTALIHQEHVAEIQKLRQDREKDAEMPNILGKSRSMEQLIDLARIAASVERTVLITGESGSGKELLAQAIHARSRRATGPFIVVDCSALSENLLESELFGHRRGSFTGAVTDKAGAFENADGGTLFLDEISDASKPMQQQLRRVLQEGEIRRVGESDYRKVDVRVVCATNRSLPDEVEEGRFIHDLYHRIHQFPMRIPPLRERKEDIPVLVDHFISATGSRKNPPVRAISAEALSLLVGRDWRANNVRELKNVVELAVDLATSDSIELDTIQRTLAIREESEPGAKGGAIVALTATPPPEVVAGEFVYLSPTDPLFESTPTDAPKEERPYYRLLHEFSGKVIVESLRYCDWKMRAASKLLGISPVKLRGDFRLYLDGLFARFGEEEVAERLEMPVQTLRRKLKDLGIESSA